MLENSLIIKYFVDKARTLSLEFFQQQKMAFELGLGDYFTEDIANDWIDEDIYLLKELLAKGIVNERVLDIYIRINDNFASVSLGGEMYDENIWTLTGLKSDPFWEKQRGLACELLNQLKEISQK